MSAIALPIYYNYTCHTQAQESLGSLATTKASWAAIRSTGAFNSPENDFSTGLAMQRMLSIELPERNWAYSATSVDSDEVVVHILAEGSQLKDCLLSPPLEFDFVVRHNPDTSGTRTGITFHVENSSDPRFIKNKN